jgi:hypothetical protein
MKNSSELYNKNKSFYDTWPCRKKMILEIFPNMNGSVLNVGVHEFNKNDGLCFPNKELYSTIDIVERNKIYGSKYNHNTIDFLDLNDKIKYDNIILFGVLNIPKNKNSSIENYNLYKNEKKVIDKVNTLLNKNGTVLFGPDIHNSTKENSIITENFYDECLGNNEVLNKNFKQTLKFIGKGNILYEYKKII